MNAEQINALRALLADIDGMQEAPEHYGAFPEYIVGESGVTVQWPNLAACVERVEKAFAKELAA